MPHIASATAILKPTKPTKLLSCSAAEVADVCGVSSTLGPGEKRGSGRSSGATTSSKEPLLLEDCSEAEAEEDKEAVEEAAPLEATELTNISFTTASHRSELSGREAVGNSWVRRGLHRRRSG